MSVTYSVRGTDIVMTGREYYECVTFWNCLVLLPKDQQDLILADLAIAAAQARKVAILARMPNLSPSIEVQASEPAKVLRMFSDERKPVKQDGPRGRYPSNVVNLKVR
jgi:hypothetical protein